MSVSAGLSRAAAPVAASRTAALGSAVPGFGADSFGSSLQDALAANVSGAPGAPGASRSGKPGTEQNDGGRMPQVGTKSVNAPAAGTGDGTGDGSPDAPGAAEGTSDTVVPLQPGHGMPPAVVVSTMLPAVPATPAGAPGSGPTEPDAAASTLGTVEADTAVSGTVPHAAAPAASPASGSAAAAPASGATAAAPASSALNGAVSVTAGDLAAPVPAGDSAAPAPAGAAAESSSGSAPVFPALPPLPVVAGPAALPAAPPSASAPAAPVPSAPALLTQVSQPLFSLAAASQGEHVMTLSVTPDTLGPVTVRAHVGADGVRIELFAPSDTGREALRALMTDLRRDLSGSGMTATLSLSSQDTPDRGMGRGMDQGTDHRHGADRNRSAATPPDPGRPPADHPRTYRPGFPASASTIDLLA
ncbi:flagellar hook-length control protein FliK [Arthrobacter yangruifuii]|uniref:flagellar hook-length control protein FliK n=1 Tax=Arthrobacter yangruifuii TaxID=2606616 RepID=UPI0011B49AA2|nr:flagellar hook-length control protein FliK [Arthrobacter yangruifuii]